MPTSVLALAKCSCDWPTSDMELVCERPSSCQGKQLILWGIHLISSILSAWLHPQALSRWCTRVPDANCPVPCSCLSSPFISLLIIWLIILCSVNLHEVGIWEPGNFLCLLFPFHENLDYLHNESRSLEYKEKSGMELLNWIGLFRLVAVCLVNKIELNCPEAVCSNWLVLDGNKVPGIYCQEGERHVEWVTCVQTSRSCVMRIQSGWVQTKTSGWIYL